MEKQALFFDPQKELEVKRRKEMAKLLSERGNAPVKNEVAGGMTVARSPWENIAQGAEKYMGQYESAKADEMDADLQRKRQDMLSQALGQLASDPQAAAQMLAQDPRTSDAAMQIVRGEIDYGRERLRDKERDALSRELIGLRAQSGGSTPAPIKIANEMFNLEQIMSNPATPEAERFLAERQYNLLGQAAKTYGFDRGLQMDAGGFEGYNMVFGGQRSPAVQQPPAPQQYGPPTQDPVATHAAAVQQRQAEIGINPTQRDDLLPKSGGISEIPGFGRAASGLAAQKKMAEGRGAEIGKRQGENENLYRSMVSRMPQLENTVERLSKLGQAATYTSAGQVRDFALRELGMEVPDAATARAEYISMVDNEILPLLRDTFGAQFTQREGETLRATLGNPNVSPAEKDAVLRSFMRTKIETLGSARRELDYGQSIPDYTPRDVTIGGQQYNPMGGEVAPQIAVNPQTGERLINRGNGWEKYQ